MTNQTEETGDDALEDPRPKKRRAKKRRPGSDARPLPTPAPAGAESPVRATLFGLASLACAGFYVYAHPGAETRSYALIGCGVTSFLFAASPGISPQRVVLLMGALVATGLAVIGARASEIGTALAMAGGLGLGGGIHRLGRLGPDDGQHSELAAAEPVKRPTS